MTSHYYRIVEFDSERSVEKARFTPVAILGMGKHDPWYYRLKRQGRAFETKKEAEECLRRIGALTGRN